LLSAQEVQYIVNNTALERIQQVATVQALVAVCPDRANATLQVAREAAQAHLDAHGIKLTWPKVKELSTCWATKGTFKKDLCLHASEAYYINTWLRTPVPFLDAASWYWQPDNAVCNPSVPFVHLDAHDVCRAFNGRNVMFVGDSLSNLISAEFVEMMDRSILLRGGPAAQLLDPTKGTTRFSNLTMRVATGLCDGTGYPPFDALFLRNDRLSPVEEYEMYRNELSDYRQSPWWQVALDSIDILVVNRGLHYVPDDKFKTEYADILDLIDEEFLTKPGRLAIVRNTPPGTCTNLFSIYSSL